MSRNLLPRNAVALGVTLVSVILVLVPFHAFLTVWLSSLVGHYTLLRLWKEFLLLVIVAISLWQLRDPMVRKPLFASKLTWLIFVYAAVQLIWGAVAYAHHSVTTKALAYGLLVNLRFLAFFLAAWVLALKSKDLQTNWRKWIIGPAILVILLALLQYFVLPYDVLRHFGYGESTIYPYETINHNIHYIRVMSTLRGANPLGAYLVMILSLLIVGWRKQFKDWQFAIFPVAGILALLLTFSRSAWIGFAVSALVIVTTWLNTKRLKELSGMVAVGIVIVAIGLFAILRHNATFQNIFAHTQDHSTIKTSSNEGHFSALRNGLRDMVHQPFGRGPGTAGPASVYNHDKVRLAENYFVQIGQETGWLGFGLFIAIIIMLGRALWRRRADQLALGLFAALIGLCIVNLLSHAWTDDTLAYTFWGLAGVAMVPLLKKPQPKTKKI